MTFMTLAGIAVLKATAANPGSHAHAEPTAHSGSVVEIKPYLPPLPEELLARASSAKAGQDAKLNASGDTVLCSLDVADWELAKVLRVLSQQTGVNVITMSSTDKKLTVRLSDVKLSDMIRHICAITGMAFLKTGGTYVIATSEQLKAAYPVEYAIANPAQIDPMQDLSVDLYVCSFVSANQIAEGLSKLFQEQKLTVMTGPGQQIPVLANAETSGTGASSSMIKSDPAAAAGSTVTLSGRTIMLRGPRAIVDAAVRLARQLDRPKPQVSIAVKVHDISNDALKELGVSWSFPNVAINEIKGNGFSFGDFTRSALSFTAVIKALEQKSAAKLLAEPNISVLDGEKAMILIGSRLNFPQLIGYSNANTPIFDRREERVGIYLQVSANISTDNEVTLSLYPQVSTVSGFLEIPGGGSYPQIATREAQTTLRVKSGETIIMGGLLRDEELKSIERVPLLSDIPILGELFKRRKTTKSASQVIISITPIVLNQR